MCALRCDIYYSPLDRKPPPGFFLYLLLMMARTQRGNNDEHGEYTKKREEPRADLNFADRFDARYFFFLKFFR